MTASEPPGPLSADAVTRIHALYDQLVAEQRGPVPVCRCGQEISDSEDPLACVHDG